VLNYIWLSLISLSVVVGAIEGRIANVVAAATEYAKLGFEVAIGLTGVMALWLGIMGIANDSGLIKIVARLLKPVMKKLFPEVPSDHPAMGAMVLNIAANMLGISNAATPLGLNAMKELEKLNEHPGIASNAMCTFLAINTSSVQLIPATAIAFLAANGATNPSNVIVSALIATSISTIAGIVAVKSLAKLSMFKIANYE
jgi:spore maturation protein A